MPNSRSGTPKAAARRTESTWQKTRVPNIVRNTASGMYYARFRVGGKLVWRTLDTTAFATAQAKLPDVVKAKRQLMAAGDNGLTLAQAARIYLERDAQNSAYKQRTRQYRAGIVDMVGRLFPRGALSSFKHPWDGTDGGRMKDINVRDVRIGDLTKDDCLEWAAAASRNHGATAFNHAVGTLRGLVEIGIEHGARFDNPARHIRRLAEKPKALRLPEPAQFRRFVECIRNSGSGWSRPCADMVCFLAYGGFRISEAIHITWNDVDFEKGEILIKGDPLTGLKGRIAGVARRVPIIQEMRTLLLQMQDRQPGADGNDSVLVVKECQRAMTRAAREIGMARITHHDLRHLFATRCIESGVDIPTVSRWLGHKDGGALAMKVYGHLRDSHSQEMASKVSFH